MYEVALDPGARLLTAFWHVHIISVISPPPPQAYHGHLGVLEELLERFHDHLDCKDEHGTPDHVMGGHVMGCHVTGGHVMGGHVMGGHVMGGHVIG